MRRADLQDELMFRMGASVLGLFAGVVVTLLVFVPLVLFGAVSKSMSTLCAAGALSGVLCGLVVPRLAVQAFEGLVHFFFAGALAVMGGGEWPSSEGLPRWLAVATAVGIIYFLGMWVGLQVFSVVAKGS